MTDPADKPPYEVPSMADIAAITPNGLNVISTFSGCGGSSLGYRMAGCTVLLASEFVPAAADVYEMNARPGTIVDRSDIREVHGRDWLERVGLEVGELDILDGSPPCAAFSTAGRGSRGWGQVRSYSDTAQRVDDLFYEFARVLRQIKPKVFVAENVAGLVRGEAKGYYKRIFAELERSGYRVACRLLDAQWLGVPQRRQRTIFVGVREDLGWDPVHPRPFPYRYAMREACPSLDGQVYPASSEPDGTWAKSGDWRDGERVPSATIGASPQTGNGRFPPAVVGHFVRRRVDGRGGLTDAQTDVSPTITAGGVSGTSSSEAVFVARKNQGGRIVDRDETSAPSATVMAHGIAGVARHQYALVHETDQGYEDPETGYDLSRVSPLLRDAYPDKHLRRLSLAELRRLCSFPDDFALAGSYAQRWERLGRAVPPLMMKAVADPIVERLLAEQ